MKFRLKALGWHFAVSATALLVILGTLYMGWYRWPGWYLAGMLTILPIVVAVDAALGPLMTFIIAKPTKPREELARDIAVIVGVQLLALAYGAFTLWSGRPLYYAYSGKELSVVQASDLEPTVIALSQQTNAAFAPYWYSRPQWVYAPPPDGKGVAAAQASATGSDSTETPSDMKPWSEGLPDLKKKLQKVDDWKYFSSVMKQNLKQRMTAQGYAADAADTRPLTGRGAPLLAIFDTNTMTIRTLLRAD